MASGKKALLLGAGFVTKPTVDILTEAGVEVTVGKFDIPPSTPTTILFANASGSVPHSRVSKEAV
jgi:hypothetical protein